MRHDLPKRVIGRSPGVARSAEGTNEVVRPSPAAVPLVRCSKDASLRLDRLRRFFSASHAARAPVPARLVRPRRRAMPIMLARRQPTSASWRDRKVRHVLPRASASALMDVVRVPAPSGRTLGPPAKPPAIVSLISPCVRGIREGPKVFAPKSAIPSSCRRPPRGPTAKKAKRAVLCPTFPQRCALRKRSAAERLSFARATPKCNRGDFHQGGRLVAYLRCAVHFDKGASQGRSVRRNEKTFPLGNTGRSEGQRTARGPEGVHGFRALAGPS